MNSEQAITVGLYVLSYILIGIILVCAYIVYEGYKGYNQLPEVGLVIGGIFLWPILSIIFAAILAEDFFLDFGYWLNRLGKKFRKHPVLSNDDYRAD